MFKHCQLQLRRKSLHTRQNYMEWMSSVYRNIELYTVRLYYKRKSKDIHSSHHQPGVMQGMQQMEE